MTAIVLSHERAPTAAAPFHGHGHREGVAGLALTLAAGAGAAAICATEVFVYCAFVFAAILPIIAALALLPEGSGRKHGRHGAWTG